MLNITSSLAKLNPFSNADGDTEDVGEAIQQDSIAGGGHAARRTRITKEQLGVSHALRKFMVDNDILAHHEAGLDHDETTSALKEFLDKPHVIVPTKVTDRSHPLTEYFISSSHNTYLLANQLYGQASAAAYETALKNGARCVEIDAWDDDEHKEEPKVTHGWTLTEHIHFRSVCEAIRDVVDHEITAQKLDATSKAAPILISLENHCSAQGQRRLVEIMKEVWGDRLLSKAVRDVGTQEQQSSGAKVVLDDLGSKITLIVEYHLPAEAKTTEKPLPLEDKETRNEMPADNIIIPELADLGVYAQSVKPLNNSWFENRLDHGPHHHLINVSESGLLALLPNHREKIGAHNSKHLMRVYPRGTRISSLNLNPVPFWGCGAQVCALNWQTFDHSMQLNEALFAGTDGYVLKPAALRADGSGKLSTGRKKHLRLHVAGATSIPLPEDCEDDDIRPYITCTLVHPDNTESEPPKRKTSPYKHHKLGIIHKGENPLNENPLWNEKLDWDFEDNELAFLRILVKSDDKFARNPILTVAAVRLLYVTSEWCFIRMLDLKGRETHCTILVRFEITDS